MRAWIKDIEPARRQRRSAWFATMLPVGLVFGLLAYLATKAILWLLDWPSVLDLLTRTDHAIYMRAAHRILAGGPLYPGWQLAGPYVLAQSPELYPPPTVYGLIVPMSLLPDLVWWIVPLAIIAAVVWYWRPSPWAWVGILICLAAPHTWTSIAAGNPAMYAAAAVALGTRWGGFGILAFLKPTLLPFSLVGVRTRAWWIAAVGLGVLSLAMLPAWLDYLVVIRNNSEADLLYSVANVPLMAIPLVAWAGRQAPARTAAWFRVHKSAAIAPRALPAVRFEVASDRLDMEAG